MADWYLIAANFDGSFDCLFNQLVVLAPVAKSPSTPSPILIDYFSLLSYLVSP
jgi:hypothetical protein